MKKGKYLSKLIIFSTLLNILYISLYSQNIDNCESAAIFNKKSREFIDNDRELSEKNALIGLQIATKFNCKEQKAEALKLLGILLTYESELDSARVYLLKSLYIFNSIKKINGEASCYLNLGNIYQYEGDFGKSINYYDSTILKASEIGDKELISAAENNKGNVYYTQGFYKEAISHYKKSHEIDKSLNDYDGVVSCLCNIGIVYDMLCDYTVALSYYYQALNLSVKVGNLYKQGKLYNNIGKVFLSMKNYKLAYDYLNTAITIRDEIEDKSGMIITLFNFAELYHSLGLYKKEAEINQKALNLAVEINDLQRVTVCLHNIGTNLLKTQNTKAKIYFLESLKIADSIEAYPEQYNNLVELIPIFYFEGKLSETEEYFNRLKYLHDSVLKVEQLDRKVSLTSSKDKNKKKNYIFCYILITLLVLIGISIIWFKKSTKNYNNGKNK